LTKLRKIFAGLAALRYGEISINVTSKRSDQGPTYQDAGVSLAASERVKRKIKELAEKTYGPSVLGGVGGFGAMYRVAGYRDPVLVSSTDPVGTKLMVAGMAGDYTNIGADLVNACVNDLIVIGADPMFFLDYIATSRLDPVVLETIVEGIAGACQAVGCALIGGETSEMPGVFAADNMDLSGFVVGVVEADQMLRPLEKIEVGDALIGVPSNGLHTNGYSLVRHVFGLNHDASPLKEYIVELGETLGESLLRPHPSYYKKLRPIFGLSKGIAHITGGGLHENVPRMLPEGLGARFNSSKWEIPQVFKLLQHRGSIDIDEMYRVFNMGLGMVVACEPEKASGILSTVEGSVLAGEVIETTDACDRVIVVK